MRESRDFGSFVKSIKFPFVKAKSSLFVFHDGIIFEHCYSDDIIVIIILIIIK